jgi:hypothetical protein
MKEMPTEEQKMHHYLGVELHNQTWDLMEKEDHTEKDDHRMEQFALGSLSHWKHSPKTNRSIPSGENGCLPGSTAILETGKPRSHTRRNA